MSVYRLVASYTGPSREAWELLCGLDPVKKTKADEIDRSIEWDTPAALDRAMRFLKGQPTKRIGVGEGSDNFCYNLGCWLRDIGVSKERAGALIFEHWCARCPEPWDPDYVMTKMENAYAHAQNKTAGRDSVAPAASTFAHYANVSGTGGGVGSGNTSDIYNPIPLASQPITKRPHPSAWVTGNDITEAEPPRVREVIPGILEEHMFKMIEGERSSHKSRLALFDMAHAVAGLPAYGADTITKCRGIYLNYENPTVEMNWRTWAARHFLRRTDRDPPLDLAHLEICNLRDDFPSLLDVDRDGQITVTSYCREVMEKLDRNAQAGAYTLLAIDGLMDAVRMAGNTRNEELVALDVIRFFEQMCVKFNASTEALIHPARSAARGKVQGSYAGAWTNRPRGFDTMGAHSKLAKVYVRKIVKRSHGLQGREILMEYFNGTLRLAASVGTDPETTPETKDEV